MKNFVTVLLLAIIVTALTAGFTTPLPLQEAIGKASMGAGVNEYDFRISAEAGSSYYVRYTFIRKDQSWDFTNTVMSNTPTYANTCQDLTYNANTGGFPIKVPVHDSFIYGKWAAEIRAGTAATAANTDPIVSPVIEFQWNGREVQSVVYHD
ncbi:MAG TPA: hypothetical protein PKB02_02370 [Anaerohalosphaeraceae bacterium]|nr:hypothetical protein [Anaerohalosphaeraceae bacterium]